MHITVGPRDPDQVSAPLYNAAATHTLALSYVWPTTGFVPAYLCGLGDGLLRT